MKKEGKNEKQSTRTKEHYYLLTCYRIIKEPVFIVSAWLRLILSLEIHMGSHVNVLTLFFLARNRKTCWAAQISRFILVPFIFFFLFSSKKIFKVKNQWKTSKISLSNGSHVFLPFEIVKIKTCFVFQK